MVLLLLLQVVSLHCNLDASTHHLMNKQRLEMMKPTAVLVNAARGPCIDEAALVDHLKKNPDFRAGQDKILQSPFVTHAQDVDTMWCAASELMLVVCIA
jgi:lactate dehydrogenase-like 2-hydroxyacid dehydrogenase